MSENRFEAFMEGDCNHKKLFEPGATAYIIWNLTRDESYVRQEGITFIPEAMRYSCTLDAYRELLCRTMIQEEEDLEQISKWKRDYLLDCFADNRPVPPLNINYHVSHGWVHTHTDGYLMRDPSSGDIYLKAQNTNDTTYAAFERLMGAVAAESYETMLYIDAASGIFVDFSIQAGRRKAKEFVLQEELPRLSKLTGITGDSAEAFIGECLRRTEKTSKAIWFIENPIVIKRVTLQHIYEGSSQFVLYVADVSAEVFRHRREQEEQQQTRSFLDALAHEYLGVQEVDLDKNEITSYRLYINTPAAVRTALDMGSYEEVRQTFLKCLVKEEYLDLALETSEPDYIRERLRRTSSFSIIVRSTSEHYLEIKTMRASDTPDDVSHIFFCFQFRDEEMAQRRKNMELEEQSRRITQILRSEFTILTYVNLDADSLELQGTSEFVQKWMPEVLEGRTKYSAFMERYIRNRIAQEDRVVFRMLTSIDNIRRELSERKSFEYSFANCDGYFWTMRYIKLEDENEPAHNIVFGFEDKNAEVREKLLQQKMLQEALKRAEAASSAKTTFLSNMSHDIRTPMNAIVGFTALAASQADKPEVVREYLSKISASGNHLLALINDVLDMSRIESGKMVIEAKPDNLSDIVDGLHTILETEMRERNICFKIRLEGITEPDVYCDRLRMEQVLMNCLSNAMKFTPAGGRVIFNVTQQAGAKDGYADYILKIRDTGIGMDSEFAKHIFEAFSRERTSTVSGIQGTGLGMAIAKRIVELMDGTIEVESAPGEGTEFTITLPMKIVPAEERRRMSKKSSAEQDVQALLSHQHDSFKGKRLLLVEDIEINREIIKAMLEDTGMAIDEAEDGDIAVSCVREGKRHYDLILMDIQMPRMDGLEATRAIRALAGEYAEQVPIIAMTANAYAEDRRRALLAGMTDFTTKPIEIPEFFGILHKYLD